jgi:hypothetical protein
MPVTYALLAETMPSLHRGWDPRAGRRARLVRGGYLGRERIRVVARADSELAHPSGS